VVVAQAAGKVVAVEDAEEFTKLDFFGSFVDDVKGKRRG
jgi:hypothetical protein